MAASISFTDGIGAATLNINVPSPGARFYNWLPRTIPHGESAVTLATGATSMFVFRTDYGASFEVRHIAGKGTGSPLVAPVDIADRLRAHLIAGGTCSVVTGDVASSTYATCGIWPGTTPELTMSDTRVIEYTLSLQLINLAGSPVRMVCRYAN